MVLTIGERYARAYIHKTLWRNKGNPRTFLVVVGGEVVGAFINRWENPAAPERFDVGDADMNVDMTTDLIMQRAPIPVFIKEVENDDMYVYNGCWVVEPDKTEDLRARNDLSPVGKRLSMRIYFKRSDRDCL